MDLVAHLHAELAGLPAASSRVGLAVSGGADSMALLSLAQRVRHTLGLSLHVVHVDHAIRPRSHDDARWVAAAAERLGLPWSSLRAPVKPAPRTSIEASARDVRYFLFDRVAHALELDWVATAHTLDDQAETVLLRAMRGTGPSGLAGIARKRGRIIRPLLSVRRAQLRQWLQDAGIPWREDPSNADLRLDRNWLRHQVMPLVESRRPGASVALARLASLATQDAEVMDHAAARVVSRSLRVEPWGVVLGEEVRDEPPALSRRAIRAALLRFRARADHDMVQRVERLWDAQKGAAVACGGGMTAWRVEAGLAFVSDRRDPPEPVVLPDRGVMEAGAWALRVRIGDEDTEPWAWRCSVDAAGRGRLWLRSREAGDRVPTRAGSRKVSDVLIDARVIRFARDHVPVLCCDDRPLAVVGLTRPPVPRGRRVTVDVDPLAAPHAASSQGALRAVE